MREGAHLTVVDTEFERQVAKTKPGMAHFALTGPFGRTCGDCAFWGYWRQVRNGSGDLIKTSKSSGCQKFHELTGRHGPALAPGTDACRYFQAKKKESQR